MNYLLKSVPDYWKRILVLLSTPAFLFISGLHKTTTTDSICSVCPPAFTFKVQLGVNHSNGPVVYSSVKCVPLQDQSEP